MENPSVQHVNDSKLQVFHVDEAVINGETSDQVKTYDEHVAAQSILWRCQCVSSSVEEEVTFHVNTTQFLTYLLSSSENSESSS